MFGYETGGLVKTALKRITPRAVLTRRLRAEAGNCVLLTFDDGPNPDVTPLVLDRLDAFDAKAVFFVVGRRARRAPAILREVLRRGHIIGNHSHLHRDAYILGGPDLTLASYYRDCQRCQELVGGHLGVLPRLFRPPGGRVSPTTLLVPRLLGMRFVVWSVDVGDWRFRTEQEAREGAAKLVAIVQPQDIVLLHDDNPAVVSLLDELLPRLRARDIDLGAGLRFV